MIYRATCGGKDLARIHDFSDADHMTIACSTALCKTHCCVGVTSRIIIPVASFALHLPCS